MSPGIFALVLLAACLHAGWNALVKGGADKTVAIAAVVIGQGMAGAMALPFAQMPEAASYPYLLAGVLLHLGYQLFLAAAYRFGDLTQVYPIARGVSPLIVAGVSALVLGVSFSLMELAAIGLIAAGIASISLVRHSDGIVQGKAVGLALMTGCFIAAYSLVDGLGARLAGTALGFFGWLAVLNAIGFAMVAPWIRPGLLRAAVKARGSLILGGGASFVAYLLVVYAFTKAPIALVTALRETSIVFALLIGVFFLRERLDLRKLVATLATVTGAALLKLYRS